MMVRFSRLRASQIRLSAETRNETKGICPPARYDLRRQERAKRCRVRIISIVYRATPSWKPPLGPSPPPSPRVRHHMHQCPDAKRCISGLLACACRKGGGSRVSGRSSRGVIDRASGNRTNFVTLFLYDLNFLPRKHFSERKKVCRSR